jgi:hypothetical protein
MIAPVSNDRDAELRLEEVVFAGYMHPVLEATW